MIGLHLTIDAVMLDPVERGVLERVLRDLPSRIDMNVLHEPVVVEGHMSNPGLTGFVIIDKSHIAIHTFTETNLISFDVFSCKEFDFEKIHRFILSNMMLDRVNLKVFKREVAS